VNGVPVEAGQDGSFAASVAIEEGHNSIVARGVRGDEAVSDSISVSLDLTPPYLTVDSHEDGADVYTPTITVTGLINDIVRGTIEATQASVTVNGIQAAISNRSYSATNVPVTEGENTLTVMGVDQVGNVSTIQFTVNYLIPEGRKITVLGGQGQSGEI